ncbi:hypothetical protein HanHA300_Chr11g0402651 [Helianthus annuus]|nr:hypothetical protein HanHA300_Chr11g0402651 [Helianthus annuus]KAJ0517515.1 hypothetical protein HanHA89_Chr11g0426151 [Helianthus annuus]KAJ0685525.1 hypothetical protein HanLR1_Chr11g0403591 [Helianthus annuus]
MTHKLFSTLPDLHIPPLLLISRFPSFSPSNLLTFYALIIQIDSHFPVSSRS